MRILLGKQNPFLTQIKLLYLKKTKSFLEKQNFTVQVYSIKDADSMFVYIFRLNNSAEIYTNEKWFKALKSRWSNYFDTLEKHWLKMYFR